MRTLALTLFCLLQLATLAAQNQVLVNVALSPPYSQRLSDYEHYQAEVLITLTNLTQQDLQMKIIGEINGTNTGLFIKTKPDYIPNQIITLAPGETRTYAGNQITGYFDNNNTVRNIPADLEADILRSGLLPQDNYDYCIEVVDVNTLAVLGRKCTLLPIQYLSPPQPNLPWCESSQDIGANPQINFSWLPPTGGGLGQANLQYDFYLIPVPAGQDPGQMMQLAMDGQLPGQFFIRRNLMAPAFLYNTLQDPPLTPGFYVWGIVARDLNGLIGIENHGQSAFCTLTLQNGGNNNGGGNQQVEAFPFNCDCKTPLPGGSNSPNLLTAGATVKAGIYSMKILETDGQGNGTGRILVPGFPGGVELPLLADFSGVEVNANREMIKGNVRAQRQPDVSFLPDIANPQLQTLPLNAGQIDQLDQYFDQNAQQLVKNLGNALDNSGFKLPLGIDKNIGGQQLVLAITDMRFDATRAALDAAMVLNLADAGTKIALSGRGICLQNGLGLCGEGTLYLAEDLDLPFIHMALRGLNHANDPQRCTRVVFDRDGFKKLHVEAIFTFPAGTLSKAQGGGQVEATLAADTDKGWSDWVASVGIDPFRIDGVSDFTFITQTAYYDHSTLYNPPNMPADYDEGKPLTWTGFFLEKLKVELPPILKKRGDNNPLSISASNVIIDSYGVTGTLSADNILQLGDGGDGHWQFSVDQFFVKFKKNTFNSGGFNGKLVLPITSRNEQSSLLYSSVLSYANNQFAYQFDIKPKNDIEVDLFAAYFNLKDNSSIQVSAGGGQGFKASAVLNGEFRIGGKFSDQLPRIDIAHVTFQNLGLTTAYPYYTPGQLEAGLASPQKSVGGFPLSIEDMELMKDEVGLKMKIDLQLSDLAGFLPNAEATMKFKGKFNQDYSPVFTGFEMSKIHIEGDFSFLKINGDLAFYSKDATWGDGFQGKVNAQFPPGFTLDSRMQIGAQNAVNYWYVDGQLGKKSDFTAGLNAYGFSGGAYYNMTPSNIPDKTDITTTENPDGYNWLGAAPSQITYKISAGSSGMTASAVIGLGTEELFNVNGKLTVQLKNGGVDELAFSGAGRMFGNPGSKGLIDGTVGFRYQFAQKILDINAGMNVAIVPGVSASAFLSMHSNATTGDWNFKVGRPLGYEPGGPCTIKFDFPPAPVRVDAGIYFQCGNFDVDGLPKRLPGFMQELFPEYPKGYCRQISDQDKLNSGNGFAVGAYLKADLTLTYLIFYARFSAVFGFDIQVQKLTQGCDNYPTPGLNGWYGTGQFYAGIKAAIGIRIDLFFISGEFEILSISFGGILTGGGPNPTWVKGVVGGRFSILGGLVSGTCSFRFQAGDVCIPTGDPLANLKLINETFPADGKELQSVDIDPAVSVNLAMDKEFFLEEQKKDKDNNPIMVPRLFKFNKSDLSLELYNGNQPNKALLGFNDYDPEGFGVAKLMDAMLQPQTSHIYKVKATVQECYDINPMALSPDGQHGKPLMSGSCSPSGWAPAKLKNNQPYSDNRTIIFKTDQGLKRLDPNDVVYSLPHHSQRFFCYQDIALQTFMGLRKRVLPRDFLGNQDDPNAPKTLKVRLVPVNIQQGIMADITVPVNTDDGLVGGELGNYDVHGGLHYWSAGMWAHLRPNTTYGVQFFMEWELPPAQQNQNSLQRNWMATTIQVRMLTDSAQAQERKINQDKYKLKKNQREVYRYYFRTSQYESIEQKLRALNRNQLVFTEFQKDITTPKNFSIAGNDLRDWSSIIHALKVHYPEDVLNPPNGIMGSPNYGICLTKAGFLGPERFDVFDVQGTSRTITINGQNGSYNQKYVIDPLIEFDRGAMKQYWDRVFQAALDTLLANGIKGNVDWQPPGQAPWDHNSSNINPFSNYFADDFRMKVYNVMGPIDTTHLFDNGGGEYMQELPVQLNNLQVFYMGNQSNSQIVSVKKLGQPDKPNLLEISRDIVKFDVEAPPILGLDIGNLWLNNAIIHWNNIPGPALPNTFFSNIGVAYDVLNQRRTPTFRMESGASGIGAGVQINLIGNGGVRPQFQLGPR